MKQSFEAHDDPDLDRVWTWFEFQIALIAESRAAVLRSSGTLQLPTNHGLRGHEAQFAGWTRNEVEQFFDNQRGQLELVTMFELLATAEAILRMDVRARIIARKKDSLSRRFRDLYKMRADKMRLDEDILTSLKEEGVAGNVIAAFRSALRLRHWLAHGRHWHPKLGRLYAPGDVFDISRGLIDSIPDHT